MKIKVNKNNVVVDTYIINRGEYKANDCEFTFTDEYTGLVKKAVFVDDTHKIEQAIINNKCDIPYEVINSKNFELRVFAYQVENDELLLRYSPTPAKMTTREGSYTENTGSGEVITPTQFEQYEQALNDGLQEVANVDIDATQTQSGASITITNRQGTEKTVTILNGENGQNGKDGKDGQDGKDGKDGQQGIGLNYNWNKTSLGIKREDEQNYNYVDLKGDKGDKGDPGISPDMSNYYTKSQVDNLINSTFTSVMGGAY